MGRFRGVELADLTLSGPRLDLRPWRPEDADRVYEALSDPSMSEFLALPGPYTRAHAERLVTETARQGRADVTCLGSAVVDRSSDRVVGAAFLWLHRDPEIGYWTAPDARGHGFATEAVRILTKWAHTVGVVRVELVCDVRNLASVRVALAAGYRFEGVARAGHQGGGADGVPVRQADGACFARLADDSGDPITPAFPPLPHGALSDGVVTLRRATPDDATGFHESDDEESARWSFDERRRTAADAAERMSRAGLDWLVGRSAQCTILDVATGRYAGDLQVRLGGPPGVAGVGYTVHPAFRGRGYTARALRLIVPWAFDVAGLACIELGAKRDNVASQRAALSAGFGPDGVRERRLRNADGTFADEICFVLLSPA